MSSKYIGATPFHQLLTHSIAEDETIKRAAEVLDGIFNKSVKAIPDLLFYARLSHDCGFVSPTKILQPMLRLADISGGLSELPEDVLDLLAWQYHVDGYDSAADVRGKRELIQRSIQLHRKKGTPWAVETALNSVLHMPISVVEWYEYGGDPYHFRVRMDVSESQYMDEDAKNAISVINEYKNVRSWLDGFSAYSKHKVNHNIAISSGRFRINGKTALWQAHPVPVVQPNVENFAVSARIQSIQQLFLKRPKAIDFPVSVAIGFFTKHENIGIIWQNHPGAVYGKKTYAASQTHRIQTRQPLYQPAQKSPVLLNSHVSLPSIESTKVKGYIFQAYPDDIRSRNGVFLGKSISRIRNRCVCYQHTAS